jgi:tetratricopeptide (TPR) repeat protein
VRASDEARQAGRIDLQARVRGLEGEIRARKGRDQDGVEQLRASVTLALEHDQGGAAAELYPRLADAIAHLGDARLARRTYLEAADFGQTAGAESAAQRARASLTIVLQQTGDWDGCARTATEALASTTSPPDARTVALGILGLVRAQRGETARARSALVEANHQAVTIELVSMELLTGWGLAMVDSLDGDGGAATRRCRELLYRWGRTQERHYVVPIVRWAVSFFASRHDERDARACASALAQIVAETGATEAVAALAHALGELCLLDGNAGQAAHHFAEALQRHDRLELPYERAHTSLRAGLALLAAGLRELGVQRLIESYRGARALGARPLANAAAHELTCLGEPLERRLGRRTKLRID